MIEQHNGLKKDLLDLGVEVAEVDYSQRGYHIEIVMNVDQVRTVAKKMIENRFYLVFVTGFQVQLEKGEDGTSYGLLLVYQFARYDRPFRVKASVSLSRDKTVPSICDIYQGANWHERETRDFFGVIFEGHPDLKPLLLREEDTDFHPLLKEEEKIKPLEAVSWQPEVSDTFEDKPKLDAADDRSKIEKTKAKS